MKLRLRDIREDHDLQQKDMAKVLACCQQTYSRYENGKSQPSFEAMDKIASYYNTSIDYLLGRTDMRDPYPEPEEIMD